MRKITTICLIFLLGGILFPLTAQIEQDTIQANDSVLLKDEVRELPLKMDSAHIISSPSVAITDSLINVKLTPEFKPNPTKAILYSAILPGLGQIYNRKYWKLPIVYGGLIGLTYAITWNGRMYNDYARAYDDIMTGNGDSWRNFIRNQNVTEADIERYKGQFKRNKDNFRRNRDLAIIATVGFYALCMLDAYVDAQLYDFDISPDLSMQVTPIMFEPTLHSKRTFGLQCSISF